MGVATQNMAEYQFENLPNFRQAGGNSLTTVDGRTAKDGIIYRSSRTDFITQKDVTVFQQLGIKSIIDLRGRREYQLSDGDKRLKKLYTPFTVKNGKLNRLKSSLDEDSTSFGNRYLISMTSVKLIWYLFNKLNIFVRWFTLLIALYDWLMSTHYFIKLYNHMVLNDISMAERYMDVLEYNKGAVRDCFKVLCDRSNLPVLIHCAHGKDRTGLIVALALSCVGVKDDDVVNDYSLSEVSTLFC